MFWGFFPTASPPTLGVESPNPAERGALLRVRAKQPSSDFSVFPEVSSRLGFQPHVGGSNPLPSCTPRSHGLSQLRYKPFIPFPHPSSGWACPWEARPGELRGRGNITNSTELHTRPKSDNENDPKTDTRPLPRLPPTRFPKPRYVGRVEVIRSSTKPVGRGMGQPRPTSPRPPGTRREPKTQRRGAGVIS